MTIVAMLPLAAHAGDGHEAWKRFAPVTETMLGAARGGFVDQRAAAISVDVARSVSINNHLVSTTAFHVTESAVVAVSDAAGALVQNGSRNVVSIATNALPAGATLIQNSLDNQRIQTLTVVDVTSTSLQFIKGLNLQSAVSGAVAASLRR